MNEQLLTGQSVPVECPLIDGKQIPRPSIVKALQELIEDRHQFKTILADPPWRYENTASRAAAENHYSTMTVEDICNEVASMAKIVAQLRLYSRKIGEV